MQPLDPARLKRFLPILFSLAMGALAVVIMNQYLGQQRRLLEQERRRLSAAYQEPMEVLVASQDLPEGAELRAEHVKTAAIPKRFIGPYAARMAGDVAGLITIAPIAEGEQILLNKLRRKDDVPRDATLAGLTPQGKRAITIGVDAITGVGGFVRPGDSVDILWTLQVPVPDHPDGQLVTLTLFQDVPVLAVGGDMIGRASATESRDYTVTLTMNPQQISFLLLARDTPGTRIQLSLRSKSDAGASVAVAPANLNSLLEASLGIKPPQPPPPKLVRQVEVFKGLKRDVVVLPEEDVSVR